MAASSKSGSKATKAVAGKGTGKNAAKAPARAGAEAAAQQRRIQQHQTGGKAASQGGAVQAGPRRQPVRMPAQHLAKPGNEHELELAPRYLAPDYHGSGKLEGMRALVTGGDSGIGRAVAVLFAREGADVAILHLDEHEDAAQTAAQVEAEGGRSMVIAGDVRDPAFCEDAVARVVEELGGLDILVNNAAFQLHCHRLEDLDDEHLQQTLQTNIAG